MNEPPPPSISLGLLSRKFRGPHSDSRLKAIADRIELIRLYLPIKKPH